MLTATLPLVEEAEFFQRMQLTHKGVQIFRAPTSRSNIQYRVIGGAPRTEAAEQMAQVVATYQWRYPEGKVIIYGSNVTHVQILA